MKPVASAMPFTSRPCRARLRMPKCRLRPEKSDLTHARRILMRVFVLARGRHCRRRGSARQAAARLQRGVAMRASRRFAVGRGGAHLVEQVGGHAALHDRVPSAAFSAFAARRAFMPACHASNAFFVLRGALGEARAHVVGHEGTSATRASRVLLRGRELFGAERLAVHVQVSSQCGRRSRCGCGESPRLGRAVSATASDSARFEVRTVVRVRVRRASRRTRSASDVPLNASDVALDRDVVVVVIMNIDVAGGRGGRRATPLRARRLP